MPRVPTYQPQIAPNAMPAARVAGQGMESPIWGAVNEFASTAVGVGMDIVKQHQQHQKEVDTISAQTSMAGLQESMTRWREKDLSEMRGLDAVNKAEGAFEAQWSKAVAESTKDLTPEARQKFDLFAGSVRVSNVGTVLAHMRKEKEWASITATSGVIATGIPLAIAATTREDATAALAGPMGAIQDQGNRLGLDPETVLVQKRRVLGEVATGKLGVLEAQLQRSGRPEEVGTIEAAMNDEVDWWAEQQGLTAEGAEAWRTRIANARKTKDVVFKRKETERQRSNVYDWEQVVWDLYDKGDPDLDVWLGNAPIVKEFNPEFCHEVRQVVQAIKVDQMRQAKKLSDENEHLLREAELDEQAFIAVVVSRVEDNQLKPAAAIGLLQQRRSSPDTTWTRAVNVDYEKAKTTINKHDPTTTSASMIWREFNSAAGTNRFGDQIIKRLNRRAENITERVLRGAALAAQKPNKRRGETRSGLRAEIATLDDQRRALYVKAQKWTADWIETEEKPTAEKYQRALRVWMRGRTARAAEQQVFDAVFDLMVMAGE